MWQDIPTNNVYQKEQPFKNATALCHSVKSCGWCIGRLVIIILQIHIKYSLVQSYLPTCFGYLPLRIRITLQMRKTTRTVFPTSWEKSLLVTATSNENDIIITTPSIICNEYETWQHFISIHVSTQSLYITTR